MRAIREGGENGVGIAALGEAGGEACTAYGIKKEEIMVNGTINASKTMRGKKKKNPRKESSEGGSRHSTPANG